MKWLGAPSANFRRAFAMNRKCRERLHKPFRNYLNRLCFADNRP
jgi:hypothetical protein